MEIQLDEPMHAHTHKYKQQRTLMDQQQAYDATNSREHGGVAALIICVNMSCDVCVYVQMARTAHVADNPSVSSSGTTSSAWRCLPTTSCW